jgi:phage terminase large subunit
VTTPTIAQVVQRRGARARPTCISAALAALRDLHALESGIQWPNPKYQKNPVGFANDIVGQYVWEAQVNILNAVRDHDRTSVRSGHKIGKSNTAALLAFWFYCSFVDARAVLTSVTARQVDAILWREVRKMRSRVGRCLECKTVDLARSEEQRRRFPAPLPCPHSSLIPGRMPDLARSGFRSDDMREIVGFTAREAEAVAGISGENILYIGDEASGIGDAIFDAIEGNRAGGAKIVLFSNPTRTEGEFFLSHTEKELRVDASGKTIGFYRCLAISSEDTPNVKQRRKVIPGLATYEWVEEKKLEWGEDSALYKVRVKGEFVLNEDGKIVSVHMITSAVARYAESCDEHGVLEVLQSDGRLHIGADPAGPGRSGDEHAFAARRGLKIIELKAERGLTEEMHVTRILEMIERHKLPRDEDERARVAIEVRDQETVDARPDRTLAIDRDDRRLVAR